MPSIFQCRIKAACNMSWTLTSTGGDLIGHNGERFAIVFRGCPSLPFLHKNDLDRLKVHRKQCLRTKVVNSLMSLRDLTEKTQVNTSLDEGKDVCVAPARVLDSEERFPNEKSGHLRKAGNCVPCAAGCGRARSHIRLDPTTRLGGCLSVDISGPHAPGVWPAPDDSQFVVTRKARYFSVAHHQTYTPEEVEPIMSTEREAVELADRACDHSGLREEESAESDFFRNENVADESDDHPGGSFWIYAHPFVSKKEAQTIVGQVNSEFQGDVTRKGLGAEQTSRRLRLGDQWRKGERVGKNQRLHGDIHCRRLRDVSAFSREWGDQCGSGLPNSTEFWPLASMFCTRPESVVAKMVC